MRRLTLPKIPTTINNRAPGGERPPHTYFNTDWHNLRFLLHPAHLTQPWHYALSILAAFLLAFSQQALEHGFALYEERLRVKVKEEHRGEGGDGVVGWGEQAVRTALLVPRVALGYVLMFMGMTLDVGILFGLLFGVALGFFLVRRRLYFVSSSSSSRREDAKNA
jgi:hypothetical protein